MGWLWSLDNERSLGRAMLWSPPRARSLTGEEGLEREGRLPSSEKASDTWRRARALSKGVMGMSPQSRMVAHER